MKYLYGLIVILITLLAITLYCSAEEGNNLIIKSGTIIRITPDLKYMTESFTEPTGDHATEGCIWQDLNTFKFYTMENGKWVNAEKTKEVETALNELTEAIDKMEDPDIKNTLEKVKNVVEKKYKDKE